MPLTQYRKEDGKLKQDPIGVTGLEEGVSMYLELKDQGSLHADCYRQKP